MFTTHTQGVSLTSLDDSDLWSMYKRNSLSTYSTWLCLYIQFMHKQMCVLPLVRSGTYQVWPSGRLILATCNLTFTSKIINKIGAGHSKCGDYREQSRHPLSFPSSTHFFPLMLISEGAAGCLVELIWFETEMPLASGKKRQSSLHNIP